MSSPIRLVRWRNTTLMEPMPVVEEGARTTRVLVQGIAVTLPSRLLLDVTPCTECENSRCCDGCVCCARCADAAGEDEG